MVFDDLSLAQIAKSANRQICQKHKSSFILQELLRMTNLSFCFDADVKQMQKPYEHWKRRKSAKYGESKPIVLFVEYNWFEEHLIVRRTLQKDHCEFAQ